MENFLKEKYNTMLYVVVGIILYTIFAFYYGIIPGVSFPSLGININIMGTMGDYSGFLKQGILYPYGGLEFEGYGLFAIGRILYLFISDLEVVTCVTYLLVYTISFISSLILAKKILKYSWLSLGLVITFYLNPFVNGHFGIPYVAYGYMLLPFSMLLDITLYKVIIGRQESVKKEILLRIILLILGRTFYVSIGWYTAVIGAVLSCLYYLISVVKPAIRKEWKIIRRYLLYCLFPWFAAMGIVLLITPKTAISYGVSMDFLHGNSLNLLTLFLPGNSQWISNLIPSYQSVLPEGTSLYGDTTMYNNYMGYGLLLGLVAIIVFLYKRNDEHKKDIVPFFVTGVVGLFLAMGPALKFLGFHDGEVLLYEMPMEDEIVFPWKFLYLLFPLRTMRAVYRWVMIPQMVVLILGFYGFKCLWEKRKRIRFGAILLCLLAIVEVYPSNGIISSAQKGMGYHDQIDSFYQDVIEPMKRTINKGDILAFAENGEKNSFLLPYIMTELQATTYQGCGDKAMAVAADFIPKDIINLQNATDEQQIAYYICQVLNKGLCDKVVIPYFDCRQDSYGWERSGNGGKIYKLIAEKAVGYLDSGYEIVKEEYFVVVSKKEKSDRYQLLYDDGIEKEKDESLLFHRAHCLSLEEGDSVNIEIPVGKKCTKLYLAMYGKASTENVQVLCSVDEYDVNDNKIRTEQVVFQQLGEYHCQENELILQENVSKIILTFHAEQEIKIKNFFATPYAAAQLQTQTDNGQDVISLLAQETSFNGAKEGEKISDISPDIIEKLNIKFDVLLKENKDVTFLSKMQHWNNAMSFDFLYKSGYFTFAFSEDGYKNENVYINGDALEKSVWNSFEINFDHSDLTIAVNGKVMVSKKLNIKKIFSSPEVIEIGSELVGEMRNISIKYN